MNENIRHSAVAMRDTGSRPEDVIKFLHASGCTPMESIKVLMETFSIGLGEAKVVVSSAPCFKDATAAAAELHDEILRGLDKP